MTKKQPPKSNQADELLDELESIKSLLNEDDLDSIPVLEEVIDDNPPLVTETTTDTLPTHDTTDILPGQQGLFEDTQKHTSNPEASKNLSTPSSDNPFLPKHIRERLGSSSEYVQELEQQQRALEEQSLTMPFSATVSSAIDHTSITKAKTSLQNVIANPDELIDSLVKQYLPLIEDDLRQRLKALIDES